MPRSSERTIVDVSGAVLELRLWLELRSRWILSLSSAPDTSATLRVAALPQLLRRYTASWSRSGTRSHGSSRDSLLLSPRDSLLLSPRRLSLASSRPSFRSQSSRRGERERDEQRWRRE